MNTFQLTFFKELNAFEIYKCLDGTNYPDVYYSFHENLEWVFEWNDVLKIRWEPEEAIKKHYLRFTPRDGFKPDRASPVRGHTHESLIELQEPNQIILVEGSCKEAHWLFDFCWGLSDSDPKLKSIDPEAKIKETGH